MELNTVHKLLKAKALGCLEHSEDDELIALMENSEEFPWKELGEYQNLVSLLPLYLPIEIPGSEVKESLKIDLAELFHRLNPVVEEELVIQDEILSPPQLDENIPEETEQFEPVNTLTEVESISEEDLQEDEELKETKTEIERDSEFDPDSYSEQRNEFFNEQKEKSEKRTRESIKKLDDEISQLDQTVKKNFLISIGIIAVLIIIIIFIYFSLSSRIDDQQDKLDRLKNDMGLQMPEPNDLNTPGFFDVG